MAKVRCVAICEQTHASGRGFACDDHIHKTCYTIVLTDAQEARFDALLLSLSQKSQADLEHRIEQWCENNPDWTECLCEGEEFVGHIWIESTSWEGDPIGHVQTETVLAALQDLVNGLPRPATVYGEERITYGGCSPHHSTTRRIEMTETKTDVWQTLMDRAYDKWQGTGWNYSQFLLNLDAAERKAVILGNFHYQVCNGGLSQWVDNGYASGGGRDLLTILAEIGTENSSRVAQIVRAVLEYVDMSRENRGCDDYWLDKEEWVDDDDPPARYSAIDKLTDEYYSFYASFTPEVEAYLKNAEDHTLVDLNFRRS